MLALAERVEAAARSDRRDDGAKALALLVESTQASGTPWAIGIEARCRALLSRDDDAEELYRRAIASLEPTRLSVDLARAHLVFGEWLRRQGQRVDARAELRVAAAMFSDFGMAAFKERASVELLASGARARRRTQDTVDRLTPQEAEVSRLASLGRTNREIATQLFLSPSTVEYHLRKVFRKLDVRTRTELARRLPAVD
jgi:DNA-binding CsgD family transcriptional regulator